MRNYRYQFICFCIGFVVVANLACDQKAERKPQAVSPIYDETKPQVDTNRTWVFKADPYGINDLLPEKDIKALQYGNSQIIGVMSKADKDQLALLAARLPVLQGIKEINSIALTSPTNAELFFRNFRVYCEKTPSNVWKIVRATTVAR